MALRTMLGRNLVNRIAPASARTFFRSAAARSEEVTQEQFDKWAKSQPDAATTNADTLVKRFMKDFPVKQEASGKDFVKDAFVDQQTKFRTLAQKIQGLDLPVDGGAAEVAKFAEQRYAMLKQVGIAGFVGRRADAALQCGEGVSRRTARLAGWAQIGFSWELSQGPVWGGPRSGSGVGTANSPRDGPSIRSAPGRSRRRVLSADPRGDRSLARRRKRPLARKK